MTRGELETAIDNLIRESVLSTAEVAEVLTDIRARYEDDAAEDEKGV